jgi:hypothetical protein
MISPAGIGRAECFASLRQSEGDFPEPERAAYELLAVPIIPN